MQRITTFLTFNNQAEEAARHYTSIFKGSRILSSSAMNAEIELEGQRYILLNGGPTFSFAQGISLFVSCETQDEVDYYWNQFVEGGGKEGRCGWLTDKFGVSWQIVPTVLGKLLQNKRALAAMMTMKKLDIAALESAAAG